MDEFKKTLHHFRRQPNDPDRIDDVEELVDFTHAREGRCLANQAIERVELHYVGRDCYQGPLYTLPDYPGFLYAPSALSHMAQLQLAFQAVTTYCQSPHTTNIQLVPPKAHESLTETPMWKLWKDQHLIASSSNAPTATRCLCKSHYLSFHKLAWATMGYHYDWTARAYPEDMASSVPSDLNELSQTFAKASLVHNRSEAAATNDTTPGFKPTACIVNYYHGKSVMGPHRDDSEHAVSKPIVSFSMGRPAVFLLGGDTRNDPVVPILVRPGDVMIMGGKTRLNFHCMARLLPARAGLPNDEGDLAAYVLDHQIGHINGMPLPNETDRGPLERYLLEHRININLRQVYED